MTRPPQPSSPQPGPHSTPSSTDPTCSSASYGSAGSAENTVAITSTDNNKYVCFRVKNNLGVFGYKKYQIDYNPPTITVNRNAYQLIGTSTDITTVDDSTWFNNGPHNTEPSACATTTGYQSGKTINNAQMHKYYCFKVSDNSGNIGYLSYTIIGPALTLTQDNTTVTVTSADGSTLTDYKYFTQASKPTNCGLAKTSGWTSGTSVTNLSHNTWVCFAAKDNTNIYGFGLLQVDLTKPTITLTQDYKTVTATGTNLSDYKYFVQTTNPTCDATKTTGWTSGTSKTNLGHGNWICFTAKNNLGVYGFAEVMVNLTQPTITLTQDGQTVSATGNSLSDYKYFTSTTNPTCDISKTTGWTSGTSKGSLADDAWICFTAKNNLGVYGFAELEVDLTAPVVSTTQNQTKAQATATTTNGTIKTGSWTHYKSATNPNNCSSITYTIPEHRNNKSMTITSADNNKYYCFRVKNSRGIYGYGGGQIDYNPPIINIVQNYPDISATSAATDAILSTWSYSRPQNSNPTCSGLAANQYKSGHEVYHAQDNKYYCFKLTDDNDNVGYNKIRVNLSAPSLNASQNNTTVTVSGTSLSGYSYQTDTYSLPCNPTLTTNWKSGKTVQNLTHKTYVCFRAKNSLGVWGFSQYQVDLEPPGLTLDQSNSGAVSLTTTGVSAVAYTTSQGAIECSSKNTTATWSSGKTTANLSNGTYVCFKAKNSVNVWGYAQLQVVQPVGPTVTLSQSGNKINASASSNWKNNYDEYLGEPEDDQCDRTELPHQDRLRQQRPNITQHQPQF